MKAFFCRAYGGPEVLELREVPTPEPNDNEVLLSIVATTVNSGDVRVRAARGSRLAFRVDLAWL